MTTDRKATILTILGTYREAAILTINDVLGALGLPDTDPNELFGLRPAGVYRTATGCYRFDGIDEGVRHKRLTALNNLTYRGFDTWRAERPTLWAAWVRASKRNRIAA